MFPLQLCHSSTSPGVLWSSSLSLPLWALLQFPLDYMSMWSPQRVANPSTISFSYLLIYRSLPCLSPKLLVADFSRSPNPQDVPQAVIDEHLQLLVQFLSQPPSLRTIQEHRLDI